MTIIEAFKKEYESEAITTRKMLSVVPDEHYQWKPHEKSMSVQVLATHIAELPTWIPMALNTTELDFATMEYTPTNISHTNDLMEMFEKNVIAGREALDNVTEAQLEETWTLREGDKIYSKDTKGGLIRVALSQTIHHRAQLGVFLRILNVPIPGSYGPSADETWQ